MKNPLFNPENLPVEAIADNGVVEHSKLTSTALRERFLSDLYWKNEMGDGHAAAQLPALKAAAVLVPLVMRDSGIEVLFTRRAAHLNDHAGQISFPGGRVEKHDLTSIETALRETEEEIGLARAQIDVLGRLPDCNTVTGYRVTPVIALVKTPFELQLDSGEVDATFEVPLSFLMNSVHHERRSVVFPELNINRQFYSIRYQEHFIWGATAGIVRNLFHFLRV